MGAGVRCGPACEETRGEGRRRDRALHWHRKKTGSEAPLGPGSLGSGGGGGLGFHSKPNVRRPAWMRDEPSAAKGSR